MASRVTVSISTGEHRGEVLARRDELIESHLELVPPIAHRVHRRLPPSFDLDDLIGEGYVGLMHAAKCYRPATHGGTPFSAFARQRIHGAMVDSIRRRAWLENTANPLEDAPQGYETPSPYLVTSTVAGPLRRERKPSMRPSLIDSDVSSRFSRSQARVSKRLAAAMRRLPARQRILVAGLYLSGLTVAQCAALAHVSEDQCIPEVTKALAFLREYLSEVRSTQVNFTLDSTLERAA